MVGGSSIKRNPVTFQFLVFQTSGFLLIESGVFSIQYLSSRVVKDKFTTDTERNHKMNENLRTSYAHGPMNLIDLLW